MELYLSTEDKELLDLYGWDTGIEYTIVDKQFIFIPNANHHHPLHITGNTRGEPGPQQQYPWHVEITLYTRDDTRRACHKNLELQDHPFFGLTTMSAEYDTDGMMVVQIPPLYQTKWPSDRWKLSPDQWVDTIEQRLRSANRHGQRELRAPDAVRRRSGLWAKALRRLRDDATI